MSAGSYTLVKSFSSSNPPLILTECPWLARMKGLLIVEAEAAAPEEELEEPPPASSHETGKDVMVMHPFSSAATCRQNIQERFDLLKLPSLFSSPPLSTVD